MKARGKRGLLLPRLRTAVSSQRTMIMAKIYPEPAKGGRGNKKPSILEDFSEGRLSEARLVLKFLPEKAEQQQGKRRTSAISAEVGDLYT
jgi:hypothetical protein